MLVMSYGEREKFYKSKAWQDCRDSFIKSKGGLCERCLKKGEVVPAEIAHHIKELDDVNVHNPSIALSWDNLQAVCRKCHGEIHGKVKRFDVAEDGTIIPRR